MKNKIIKVAACVVACALVLFVSVLAPITAAAADVAQVVYKFQEPETWVSFRIYDPMTKSSLDYLIMIDYGADGQYEELELRWVSIPGDSTYIGFKFSSDGLTKSNIYGLRGRDNTFYEISGTGVDYFNDGAYIESIAWSNHNPYLTISFTFNVPTHEAFFTGDTSPDTSNGGSNFEDSVLGSLDDIINGTDEMQDAANRFENSANDAAGKLDDASNALDSITKPDININDFVPTDILGSDFVFYTNVIKVSWENDTLVTMVTILAGFLMLSLLLNGQRK